jgi:hypothetical protein
MARYKVREDKVVCNGKKLDGSRCTKWAVRNPAALKKHGLENHPEAGRLCYQHLVGPEGWSRANRRGGHRAVVKQKERRKRAEEALAREEKREQEKREQQRQRLLDRLKPLDAEESIEIDAGTGEVFIDGVQVNRAEREERERAERTVREAGAREAEAMRRWRVTKQYAGL